MTESEENMKTLILTWAIGFLAMSLKYDGFFQVLGILSGMILLELYHSKWLNKKLED